MTMMLQEALSSYLAKPGAARARELQQTVRRLAGFEEDTPWIDRAIALAQQSRHDELARLLRALMPASFGCPVAHQLYAEALAGLGDAEGAERERAYAALGLELIEASGDGSRAKPWWVLHVVDQYAFLDAHGHEVVSQQLIMTDPAHLDAIECADGVVRHFALEAADADS
ncbi:hypothetical protein [Parenemella sanctibonifatiensis]|uniref:Uncharacterized protein n=1 Tax=Parenemella sanctibonifatiensis TaxID=2016505 RepID=A0A255EM95_9ACTN|nr:hypothetical protein [Parenemella sanctibonifatiensis]OYN92657.1 hypothetical protein CGZ91_04080 [Parenemella sanctibonifatiensis]